MHERSSKTITFVSLFGIDWGEDTIFNYTYYSHVSKLKGVPFTLYHVMKQKVSLTTEAKYDYFLSDSRQKKMGWFL